MALLRVAILATCSLLLLLNASWARASVPPVDCDSTGCTVSPSYREWVDGGTCRFRQVFYPTTEKELVAAVAYAVRSGTKVRVVSRGAHAYPKLVCPAGQSGILISTRDYNSSIHVDSKAGTVTVDAGVMLEHLVQVLAASGVAIPFSPYWSGLSISGLLATGAHGSSLWGKGSAVHEYVTKIRIVVPASAAQGYAEVKTFSAASSHQDLAAARVHLGVLGAVSQVTLQVQPQFKRNVTFEIAGDGDIEARLLRVAKDQEFGDVIWYPSLALVRYRADNRVPLTTSGDGLLEMYPPFPVPAMEGLRSLQLGIEATRNTTELCAFAAATVQGFISSGFGLANSQNNPGSFEGYPVVGFNHLIMTSGACANGPRDLNNLLDPANQICSWDIGPKGNFYHQEGISVPLSKAGAFFRDVKRLLRKAPKGLCGLDLYNGILMRFVKGDSRAYLGKTEDSLDLDFSYFRASDGHTPVLNQDVIDEVIQMAWHKYGGQPHWGKGRPVTFTGVAAKYPGLKYFLQVKKRLDPHAYFSNEWTDAVLGIRGDVSQLKPFCALQGLCLCSQDVHCAPDAGYFCRRGLVYTSARVCRFEPPQM